MSKPKKIEIHLGHFGDGTGAKSLVDEVRESRKIAKEVYRILQENKVPSTYFEDTKSKNQKDNINTLVKHHNADRNGLIVSFHLNSSGTVTSSPIGTEVLYSTQKALADKLSKAITDAGDFKKNRGAKYRSDIGVLVRTYEPSVLLETFFVNSRADVDAYNKNFNAICFAIAKVLASHIGYTISDKPKAPINSTKWRVKSGSFRNERDAREAVKLVGRHGIASEKWCTIYSDNGVWRFNTGAYKTKAQAEAAVKKMKDKNILSMAYVIEA